MSDATPPLAPPRAVFPCPGLVAQAANAPLGGPREALLGAIMAVRLAAGLRGSHPLPVEARLARAAGGRGWLTAIAVPTKLRAALQTALAASTKEDRNAVADALQGVLDLTTDLLDRLARAELTRLIAGLRADAAPLAGAAPRP